VIELHSAMRERGVDDESAVMKVLC
jgi:hypothetical protein